MSHTPYVYRLTDVETGKQYIGARYAKKCEPSDLGVTYFTSSKKVQPLYKANPDRFTKQIIVTGDTNYVIRVEKSLLDLHDAVVSDRFYNRTSGKAIHPDDVRRGLAKEHLYRSKELYRSIVQKMHAKTTNAQRSIAGKGYAESIRGPKLASKMEMMRASRSVEGKRRAVVAMLQGCTAESRTLAGKRGGTAGGPIGCKITNAQRWECMQCGMVTLPGPLGKHQSRSGHVGKVRIA